MKQRTLLAYNAGSFKQELEVAISMGWTVQSVTVNSETDYWFAVLTK